MSSGRWDTSWPARTSRSAPQVPHRQSHVGIRRHPRTQAASVRPFDPAGLASDHRGHVRLGTFPVDVAARDADKIGSVAPQLWKQTAVGFARRVRDRTVRKRGRTKVRKSSSEWKNFTR